MPLTPQQRKEARLALGFPTIEAWAEHIGRHRERVGLWEAGKAEAPVMYDLLLEALLELRALRAELDQMVGIAADLRARQTEVMAERRAIRDAVPAGAER